MIQRFVFNRLLMLSAVLALLVAAWAGLLRLGWSLPPMPAGVHGPLMIAGFMGTLISLERAVALASLVRRGALFYWVPALSALGSLLIVLGGPLTVGIALIAAASAGLVLAFVIIVRHLYALFSVTMLVGALCWLIGNLLWLAGEPLYLVVYWWVEFLVLTVAGERLELSRIRRLSLPALRLFVGVLALIMAGLLLIRANPDLGVRVEGVGLGALGLWLLRYDIARRTVRQAGLPRFVAACLLAGYGWLVAGGLLRLALGPMPAGPAYDAVVHSILLGFVFSMIFGHAPIIVPAVLGREMTFSPLFYVYWALLHLSLFMRIVGDLTSAIEVRQWGGMLNVIALLLFLAGMIMSLGLRRPGTH